MKRNEQNSSDSWNEARNTSSCYNFRCLYFYEGNSAHSELDSLSQMFTLSSVRHSSPSYVLKRCII